MSKEELKPENARCPYCGHEVYAGEYLYAKDKMIVRCGSTGEKCRLFPSSGPVTKEEFPAVLAAWNKRFVCPDMNGKAVYAGDEVCITASDSKGSFTGKARILACIPVDGCPMPLEYLRCDADSEGVELFIELIQEGGK